MRLISVVSIVFVLALTFAMTGFVPASTAQQRTDTSRDGDDREHQDDDERKERTGESIFRYDTFGDEQLWTDVLRMHEVIATVPPATALAVGSRSMSKHCRGTSSPRCGRVKSI